MFSGCEIEDARWDFGIRFMAMLTTGSNCKIYYEYHGSGDPLLLISGTGHDHTFWAGQLSLLSRYYRCIVFDNRGVGNSSSPQSGYSLADMADDAAAILIEAGIGNAHVMGFSMGGHIAQCLALNYPDLVRSLGIHHSWSRNCERLRKFQSVRKDLAERGMRNQLADMSLLMLYEPQYYEDHSVLIAAKREQMIASMDTLEGWIGQLNACITGDTHARLGELNVPTLITCSDKDAIVAIHRARELHANIQNSELKILTGSGHVALIEKPALFAEICADFLGRQR